MGPIATLFVFALFAALTCASFKVWTIVEPPLSADTVSLRFALHVARVALTFAVLAYGIALLDAYVVPVHMPFAPRAADVPASSPPPAKVPSLDLSVPASTKPTASDEHRAKVREWAERDGR